MRGVRKSVADSPHARCAGGQGGWSAGGADAEESFAIDSESSPGEFNGGRDVGVEALVNWAGMGGAFEFQPILWGDWLRYVDLHGKALDHARGGGGHLLFDGGGGSGDIDFQRAGQDAHHGEHAGAERGGDEVGGREALAAALVVLGGVGIEFGSGGTMHGLAVQVSLIFDLDGDHVLPIKIQRNWVGLKCLGGGEWLSGSWLLYHTPVQDGVCEDGRTWFGRSARRGLLSVEGNLYTGDRFRCDYKMFYTHVDPAMKIMAALISQGRIADEIMQLPEMRVSATDDATAGHLAKGSVR